MKPSVRTRLALTFGGLFLLAGAFLLLMNYTLVSNALPEPGRYAERMVASRQAASFGIEAEAGTVVEKTTPVTGLEVSTVFVGDVVTDYRSSALQTVLWISGIGLLVVGALAGFAGWLMAGRVLRPVQRITATARRLEAGRMDRRINLDGPGDELKELADTFDGMLDRLAGSFDSQRRFVANASHELRTPLAVQRTLVEVAMADPTASPGLMRLGAHLLNTNERTEHLIEGLLVLARSDRGLAGRAPVRLDHIVTTVVESLRHQADDAGVEITTDVVPRSVAGDATLLERLVANVVQNAVHYNERGGTVLVEVGEWPALVVTNTGPVVPPSAVSGLFEPFRRLDKDRTAHRTGAGLGLSIVRSVAQAHGGGASATANPAGGLRVSVKLPVRGTPVAKDAGTESAGSPLALGAHGGD